MVRIAIEASERIGLACEAEAATGPAIMSVRPQCRQRPLNAGQILTATVRYWQGSARRRRLRLPMDASRPRLCENAKGGSTPAGRADREIPLRLDRRRHGVCSEWLSRIGSRTIYRNKVGFWQSSTLSGSQ